MKCRQGVQNSREGFGSITTAATATAGYVIEFISLLARQQLHLALQHTHDQDQLWSRIGAHKLAVPVGKNGEGLPAST